MFKVRDLMTSVLPDGQVPTIDCCDAGCSGPGSGCTNLSGQGTPNCGGLDDTGPIDASWGCGMERDDPMAVILPPYLREHLYRPMLELRGLLAQALGHADHNLHAIRSTYTVAGIEAIEHRLHAELRALAARKAELQHNRKK